MRTTKLAWPEPQLPEANKVLGAEPPNAATIFTAFFLKNNAF